MDSLRRAIPGGFPRQAKRSEGGKGRGEDGDFLELEIHMQSCVTEQHLHCYIRLPSYHFPVNINLPSP